MREGQDDRMEGQTGDSTGTEVQLTGTFSRTFQLDDQQLSERLCLQRLKFPSDHFLPKLLILVPFPPPPVRI